MVRIDAKSRLRAVGILLETLAVGALERDRLEQYHHDEIEPPHFVRLPKAVYPSHLALLVRIRKDADGRPLAGDAHHEILATFLVDVLA